MPLGSAVLLVSKISLILLFLLLALALLRHESAARRTLATQLALIALLLLPLVWTALPSAHIVLPLAWSAVTDAPLVLPDLPGLDLFTPMPEASDAAPASGINWGLGLLGLYLSVASALLLNIAWSIRRLYHLLASATQIDIPVTDAESNTSLDSSADSPSDGQWHHALQQLRTTYGITRAVRLAVSSQVQAPISFGLWHPVIMIDPHTLQHIAPQDVLRHELAHIAQFDWVSLIVGRIVCAVYWFHPLVWLMFRHLAFNMECKTDDAVLHQGAVASDYAQTLMRISQRAHAPEPVATPLAGQGRTLMSRLMAILEAQRQRQPVSPRLWASSVIATIAVVLPLGSLAFIGEQISWPYAMFIQSERLSQSAGKTAADELDKLNNPNFTALAQALRKHDYAQRHALDIESFRQRAAIAPLVLALHDANPMVRRLALWGFGEMRFAETGPVMAAMLTDRDPLVRAEAARALAELQDVAWTLRIVPLLQDQHAFVRASAAHALGDLQDPRSIAALKAALPDKHADVVEEVQWALMQIEETRP